jgi:hypothetical protein
MLLIEFINQAGGVSQTAALLQLERALLAELEGCIAFSVGILAGDFGRAVKATMKSMLKAIKQASPPRSRGHRSRGSRSLGHRSRGSRSRGSRSRGSRSCGSRGVAAAGAAADAALAGVAPPAGAIFMLAGQIARVGGAGPGAPEYLREGQACHKAHTLHHTRAPVYPAVAAGSGNQAQAQDQD